MQSKKNHGITALYPRLSWDDDVQGDSNSIVNQKSCFQVCKRPSFPESQILCG